jgi:hypothetical protein
MNIVRIPIVGPGASPVLAGKLDGKRMFLRSLEAMPVINVPTLIVLDFRGIELATSSFLDEAVVRLRDHLRLGRAPSYLVVANLSAHVQEELEDLLTRANDAMLACNFSRSDEVSNPRLLGALDPKLSETFELVRQRGLASAVDLHNESDAQEIGQTAWNNRLNTLAAKSLLMEVPEGRTKKYRAVLDPT